MSNILRSTLRYSIRQFRINCLRSNDGVFISRSSPCINQLLQSNFSSNVSHFSQVSIDQHLKKLDTDARRNGRLSVREVVDVFQEIKSLRFASANQSLMVIRCCGELMSEELPAKRTQLVQEIWNTLEKLGVNLDISHYNALLKVYLENEHPFVPTDILAELEQKGIDPNRVTYQRFIARYCQIGDIEGATRILQFMREKEMPINEVVFNALILGHSNANDMESAEGILHVMKQGGIDPTSPTYTILICGYIKQGNMDKVESLLKECEANDIFFLDSDYLEMVYHLSLKNLDIDEVLSKVKRNTGYNQDAMNYVYKLIAAGKIESAYKIVKSMVRSTRLDGTLSPTGGFFVSALIRYDIPIATTLEYCDKLINENLNLQALTVAMENSLRLKKESFAHDLFRAATDRNIPLRTHYFWPLLVTRGKENDLDGVYKVLNTAITEFNVPITMETIREYVLPFALKDDTDIPSLVENLKSNGVSIATSISAIVTNLLLAGRIDAAAEIASNYRASYAVYLIRKPLVNAFLQTSDVVSFTTLLKHIAAGIQWRAAAIQESAGKGDEEEAELPEYREIIGQIVLDVVKQYKNKNECKATIEEILRLMQEKDVGISSRTAESIQSELQDKLTNEISTLLEKLTADDLPAIEQITPVSSGGAARAAKSSSKKPRLESLVGLYESMKDKGEISKSIQKQLFSAYGRNHDLKKLLELKEEMEKEDFVFTNGMYAYIIDAYVEHENLDEAWKIFHSRCEQEPDFVLNPLKMLRLAFLAVKNEQYDKSIELLSKKASINDNAQSSENTPFVTGSVSWGILNHFAEKGDVEKVKQFFNLIIDNEYCTVNNILLGPLIKVHLTNNDLEAALKEFENCCIKYRATPFKTELTKRCIETEDAVSLQRLTDLSTQIHGEINSLYDLMLSFLECGRLKQAKKILETPGLRLRQDRLQNACQKYQNSGSIQHLENLLAVTKDIGSLDRSDLYYNLLLSYDKAGEPQKAMSLWLQMQEDNETPADTFLVLLADILKKHNLPVPFTVPTISSDIPRVKRSESRIEMSQVSKEFRKLLRKERLDEALSYKSSKKPEEFNNTDLSLLLEALVKHGRYSEAKVACNDLLSRGVLPIHRMLKYFTINAMIEGDVEILENIKDKIHDSKIKSYIRIDDRIGMAYIGSGRVEQFLDKLEKELDSLNSKGEVEEFSKNFPKGVFFALLQKSPEYLPQVERLANKCLERDSQNLALHNALWLHHLIQKNYDEADKIWKNYLQNTDKLIAFKGLCNRAVDSGNLEVLQKLKSTLELKPNGSAGSMGIVYGSLIKVLVAHDQVPEAVKVLEEAVSRIQLENIMINALETLKIACASRNIPFDYEISRRRSRNTDVNDSDSD